MPLFAYKAVRRDGVMQEGHMEAADRATLIRSLQAQAYLPISAETVSAGNQGDAYAPVSPLNRLSGWRRWFALQTVRETPDDAAEAFFAAMAPLLEAQLDLQDALAIVAELPEQSGASLARQLLPRLRQGDALAVAMAGMAPHFKPYQIALVQSGEAAGHLAKAMAELARFLKEAERLRHELRSALVYPGILLATALMSMLVLLLWVLPGFQSFVETNGGEIGGFAQFIFWLSGLLRDAAPYAIVGLGALLIASRLPGLRHRSRQVIEKWKRSLPAIGPMLQYVAVERFCRALSYLHAGGVALPDAVALAEQTIDDPVMASRMRPVVAGLREGGGFTQQLRSHHALPGDAIALLEIGERAGALANMALAAADLQAETLRRRLARTMTWFTPVLTLLLGLMVGLMIVAVLETIFSVYDASF